MDTRTRLIVLAVGGLIAIAVIAVLVEPARPPVTLSTPARFDIAPATVRNELATGWSGPVASGSGTRCEEAHSGGAIWRTCESATGELLTVSVRSAAFEAQNVRRLLSVVHAGQDDQHDAWIEMISQSPQVETCTTAGPLGRFLVDGRVVVSSNGACRSDG